MRGSFPIAVDTMPPALRARVLVYVCTINLLPFSVRALRLAGLGKRLPMAGWKFPISHTSYREVDGGRVGVRVGRGWGQGHETARCQFVVSVCDFVCSTAKNSRGVL